MNKKLILAALATSAAAIFSAAPVMAETPKVKVSDNHEEHKCGDHKCGEHKCGEHKCGEHKCAGH